jgi:hypothetical protein
MDSDDITRVLEEVEEEVARIEAEIMGPPAISGDPSGFRPLSLASLSFQCKSTPLRDLLNISLNTHNMPTTWAQNEARSAAPRNSNALNQSGGAAQHRPFGPAAAPVKVAPAVSNHWKRCLFSSVGMTKPLALMWSEALSSGISADAVGCTVAVPGDLLRFLPLIDPQFDGYATANIAVNFNIGDLQVVFPPRACYLFFTLRQFVLQALSAATLFALSSSASSALLHFPLADSSLNRLLSLAFGVASCHEDVLWQGELHGTRPQPRIVADVLHAQL